MTRGRLAWGAATVAPFAVLLFLPSLANAILGTTILVGFAVAVLTFTATGVLGFLAWWQDRSARVSAVEETLHEMGYASTRNAKQAVRRHRGS